MTDQEKRRLANNHFKMEYRYGVPYVGPMSIEEAMKANPKFVSKTIPNPDHRKITETTYTLNEKGIIVQKDIEYEPLYLDNPAYNAEAEQYHHNCATCCPAYVLRMMGFDVTARGKANLQEGQRARYDTNLLSDPNYWYKVWKKPDGKGAEPTLINDWMAKNQVTNMTPALYKRFIEENTKEEGIYVYTLLWKGKSGKKQSGHSTIIQRWKDKDGNMHLHNIEPQSGSVHHIDKLCEKGAPVPGEYKGIMRVDNKLFDTKHLNIFEFKQIKK
jgi:hypothetical protein